VVRRDNDARARTSAPAHAGQVFGTLVAIALAQAFDLATFVVMLVVLGPAAERNPIVGAGAASIGIVGLAFAKAALVLLVVTSIVILRHGRWGDHPRMAGLIAIAAIVAGIVGGTSNVLTVAAAA
jgi:hypothetical protein